MVVCLYNFDLPWCYYIKVDDGKRRFWEMHKKFGVNIDWTMESYYFCVSFTRLLAFQKMRVVMRFIDGLVPDKLKIYRIRSCLYFSGVFTVSQAGGCVPQYDTISCSGWQSCYHTTA